MNCEKIMKKIFSFFHLIFYISFVIYGQKPELIVPIGHAGNINITYFSPDDKFLITECSKDGSSKIWETSTGKLVKTFGGYFGFNTKIQYSSDGKYIISISYNGSIIIWESATMRQISSFRDPKIMESRYIIVSSDLKFYLSISSGTANLWEISTNKMLHRLIDRNNELRFAKFSMDGEIIVTLSSDSTAKIWKTSTGHLIQTIDIKSQSKVVFFSQDSKYIIIPCEDDSIRCFNTISGILTWIIQGQIKEIKGLTICSPDGNSIVLPDDSIANVFKIHSGELDATLSGHNGLVNSASFSKDGNYIVTASDDGTTKIWNSSSYKLLRTINCNTGNKIFKAIFSPDGKHIATCDDGNTAEIWDTQTGNLVARLESHTKSVFSTVTSADGKFFLTLDDSIVKVWNSVNGSFCFRIFEPGKQITSAIFSSDGNNILTSSGDKTIKIWETSTGKIHSTIEVLDTVKLAIFSPDGKFIVTCNEENTIRFFSTITGNLVSQLMGIFNFELNKEAISSDSKYIIIPAEPDDSNAKVYEISSGKLINILQGHSGCVYFAIFSSDGNYMLTAGWDYFAKIWEISTGKCIRNIDLPHLSWKLKNAIINSDGHDALFLFTDGIFGYNRALSLRIDSSIIRHVLYGHNNFITSVSFYKKSYIVTSSYDCSVKFWDIQSGKEIATLISVDSTDWIITTPSGLFDASEGAMKLMHYVVGMEVIEFNQLKDRYWQPGLLPILLGYSKEPLREVPAFDYVRLYPEKELTMNNEQLTIELKNRGGGIGRVSIYVDDIELIEDARASFSDISREELSIKVDLNYYTDKLFYNRVNVIKVIAWNAEGYLSSRPDTVHYIPRLKDAKGNILEFSSETENTRPAFYSVVVGTSDYSGTAIDLNFASKDATDMAQALELGSHRLFGADSTQITLLTTDDPDHLPHKKDIRSAFENLRKVKPKDVVVFYFSGHGVNYGGQDGDFYYLTMDARVTDASNLNDPYFSNFTISSRELTDWINAIPARKKVLILDACASGQATEDILLAMNTKKDVPASQIRALDRMSDRTGFYILAGSAANQASYETSLYGQGVLTYSLLRGIKGECLRVDGGEEYIDIKRLFEYAEDQVPRLAENIGGIQKPFARGIEDKGSFDIGRMENEDKTKIVISEPKPVFMACTFQDEDQLYDVLGLSDLVNAQLREITAKGKVAEFCFTEGKGYPNAYQLSGSYSIQGNQVKVNYIIRKGTERIGDKFSIQGDKNYLKELVNRLLMDVKISINKI